MGAKTSEREIAPEAKSFVDSNGVAHSLQIGYRSKVKPGWKHVVNPLDAPMTAEAVKQRLVDTASRVTLGVHMLAVLGGPLEGKDVLAAGCGDGEEVFHLAGHGAASVIGADRVLPRLAEPFESPSSGGLRDSTDASRRLLLAHVAELGRTQPLGDCAITWAADDMCASSFSDEAFDVICSWRTLEHLDRPGAAFAEMRRLLRPGGVAFHEYNPFFAVDGGHSLVTLDFPWGHVRLTDRDVERYLRDHRPGEFSKAIEFYRRELNRMTIGDVERYVHEAGLEVRSLVPRSRTEDLLALPAAAYEEARLVYPRLTLNDLICRIVRIVLRRP